MNQNHNPKEQRIRGRLKGKHSKFKNSEEESKELTSKTQGFKTRWNSSEFKQIGKETNVEL